MRDFFLSSPWPGTIAWAAIYISDFVLTISCARLYDRRISSKIVFEGSFELNPVFKRDVDARKFWSLRFFLLLILTSTLITVYWILTIPSSPDLYTSVLGAMICAELAVHVRHLMNLHLNTTRLTTEYLRGRIEYRRPLILRNSAVQVFGFAALFGVVFAFTGNWFVGGGMVSCFALSLKHWYLAYRALAKQAAEVEPVLANERQL